MEEINISEQNKQDYLRARKDLERQLLDKGSLDVSNFALVRATDNISENGEIKPLSDIPFVTNTTNVQYRALFKILKEKNNVSGTNEEEIEKLIEYTKQYTPLSSQYRSTVHFTLNGLVTGHSKGDFKNKNFIIIDKLDKHLGNDDFRSIKMEDTFTKGKIKASSDAKLLINKNKYEELHNKYPYIDSYNIVLFNGNEKEAVDMTLLGMGILPEDIKEHGAELSDMTTLYENYISTVFKDYGIDEISHVNSPEYRDDDNQNLRLWQIYDSNFYNGLFDHFNVDENTKETMISYLTSYRTDRFDKEEKFKNFILNVGLENYMKYVTEYNKNIKEALENGKFPTNNEILSEGMINVKGDASVLH